MPKIFKSFRTNLILLIIACVVVWQIAYPSGSWRYKMTVTVNSPEGIKTGSAVRQVTVRRAPELTPETRPSVSVRGDAVVVDLGKRGVLYALLGSALTDRYAHSIVFEAFPIPGQSGGGTTRKGIKYYKYLQAGPKDLPPDLYPMFVTFRDPNDAKSIQPVYARTNGEIIPAISQFPPAANAPDFEDVFGKGVSLKSVTIEMTFEPITREVSAYLPSSSDDTGFMQWLRTLEYGDPRRMLRTEFKRGI